jgi:hypothetical protein
MAMYFGIGYTAEEVVQMSDSLMIQERIREIILKEILDMYAKCEVSANIDSQMFGIPGAPFYNLLAETNTPLPDRLNESIKKEVGESLR